MPIPILDLTRPWIRQPDNKTQSILCMPVITNEGKTIGVTQVLNKMGGPFGPRDEKRLTALGAQAAISLENARLFEDVLNARNYSESILKCLSNGVITLDSKHHIIKVNAAALRILKAEQSTLTNQTIESVLASDNQWVIESLSRVETSGEGDLTLDADIALTDGETTSVNLNIECLYDVKERTHWLHAGVRRHHYRETRQEHHGQVHGP